jgi:putative chitinase
VQPDVPAPIATQRNALADGVLRQGERGDQIKAMQETLTKLGYRDAQGRELVPDAHFGARTEDALRAFQRDHGLKDDGIAGPRTLEALKIGERQPLISDASHPGNPMYRQALSQLEQLGPQAGFRDQQEMQNAAASLAFEAKVSGLSRIDHVALGTNGQGLFAVQGRLDDPGHHRIYADREAAAQQPVERSSQQWQQDAQQQQSQQAQAQQREPARMSI